MSYRSPSQKKQPIWLRAAFIVLLAATTYSLQELEQSSFVALETNLSEINLEEAELPQFLLSMSKAAFNRSE
ncbi:MAG: hypothetical protein AAF716_18900 [Cyanobacteria bacterium P01_D01_bin.1]